MKILLLSLLLIPFSMAYAENIVYTNAVPKWYEYDCTDSLPDVWNEGDPDANKWKYFSYVYENNCFATLLSFDLVDIANIENTTSISYSLDSNGVLITDRTLSDNYEVSCDLLYFDHETPDELLSITPEVFESFSCSGDPPLGEVQQISMNFTGTQFNQIQTEIQDGNFTLSFMIFPHFNSTMLSNLDANNYEYGVEKHKNDLSITGDGFVCYVIQASNFCNFLHQPWDAVGKALGSDIIGDWFLVIIFFPIPMCVFLMTRTGLYAGFVGLGVMLVIETLHHAIFEVALSMVLICAGFGFYDIIRKKIFE